MPTNPNTITRAREIVASGRNDRKRWLDILMRRFTHLDGLIQSNRGGSYDAAERAALAWAISELASRTNANSSSARAPDRPASDTGNGPYASPTDRS